MTIARTYALTLAAAGCVVLLHSQVPAQDPGQPRFAAPKRIHAGDGFLGEGRLYPSPVLHDIDGDKRPDIVVGDLRGKVTVACRETGDDKTVRFGAEKPLKDRSGEQLKFHNW